MAVATSDEDGVARSSLASPGVVTAVVEHRHEPRGDLAVVLYTVSDVHPGDSVKLGTTRDSSSELAASGVVAVHLPGEFDGAAQYVVDLGCAKGRTPDATTALHIPINERCLGADQRIDALAFALSASGQPLAFSSASDIPVDGVTMTDPVGNGTRVDIPRWSTDWVPIDFHLVRVPPHASILGVQVGHVKEGLSFDGEMSFAELPLLPLAQFGWPISASLKIARFSGQFRVVVATGFGSAGELEGLSFSMSQNAALPRRLTLDVSDLLLPRIPGVIVSAADPARPEARWAVEGSLDKSADAGLLVLSWWQPEGLDLRRNEWWILLPPSNQGRYTVPSLPGALARYRPSELSRFAPPGLIFIDIEAISGYRELLAKNAQYVFAGTSIPMHIGRVRATIGGAGPFSGSGVTRVGDD